MTVTCHQKKIRLTQDEPTHWQMNCLSEKGKSFSILKLVSSYHDAELVCASLVEGTGACFALATNDSSR